MNAYAELHCLSNFSFGRGASSAHELFERAKACGYTALAITDECSLAGIVRALEASRETGLKLIVGAELLALLCATKAGYTALCELITRGRRASRKGSYRLTCADLAGGLPGTFALWLPAPVIDAAHGHWMRATFGVRAWLAVELHHGPDDVRRLRELQTLAREVDLPLLAAGDVHMHVRRRLALQHTLTAIRHRVPIAEAGALIFRNGERHLRRRQALDAIYPAPLLQASVDVAARCHFTLDELRYRYPSELVPAGHSASSWLRQLTEEGVRWRWPAGPPQDVHEQIEHELALIAELKYEPYFLTVYDIVRFARSQHILCQGRGSAANSAVCFALGITEVDPARMNLLVERFISKERDEPPDIDVDFEHARREEVIQYIYRKYGRERAALTATVICYRGRSALRDVAKALGLPLDQVDQLSQVSMRGEGDDTLDARLRERGFDPHSPLIQRVLKLAELVPVENAAMPERTIIQWDKDDLDTMKLLKVDCLALGMLTCVRRCLDLLRQHRGQDYTLATLPAEDAQTYRMIQRADTVGVFQIESRAQMAMSPRLRAANFYDLVIQVALVRPGPIQGGMVHPYLRRRCGEEMVDYPSDDLKAVLERTLGVPLFQEQVMKLAIVAAGYTAGEADQLRRAMAAWKRHGGMEKHRERITHGMLERGYSAEFAAPPSQIVQDAQRHRIEVRAVDVEHSEWDCTLEGDLLGSRQQPVIRLGLRQIRGLSQVVAQRLTSERSIAAFTDVADLCARAGLDHPQREALAAAGALRNLAGHRHQARWAVAGVERQLPLFGHASPPETVVDLPPPSQAQDTLADYARLGLSLGPHPLQQIRARLLAAHCMDSRALRLRPAAGHVRTAGLVTQRQRPQTASGVTFITLEDEFGPINVIVWRQVAQRQHRTFLEARLLGVEGRWEQANGVSNLIAHRLVDMSDLLGALDVRSRDFH